MIVEAQVDVTRLAQPDLSRHQSQLIDDGKFDQAERSLKLWLKGNGREVGANISELELSRVLFWRGKPTEAKTHVEEVIQRDSQNTWAVSILGQIEVRLGNFVNARALFEHALKLDPNNHEAKTFLQGDMMDQMMEVKHLLTHRKLSPQGRIRVAELCQAIDFKRNKIINLQRGDLTQQQYDRLNLMLDMAEVGEDVDGDCSLRGKMDNAEEVVFYTSNAFGDAILGLSSIQALLKYFDLHPEKRKPIEIVTPFTEVFSGLAEQNPHIIKLKKIGKGHDMNEAQNYGQDLKERTKKTFAYTNSGPEVYDALLQEQSRNPQVVAMVDAYVNRLSSHIEPWRSPREPYPINLSYGGKMYRFMEMVLGEKLISSPDLVQVQIPLAQEIKQGNPQLLQRYGLTKNKYHCLNESASISSKRLSSIQMNEIINGMVAQCVAEEKSNSEIDGTRKVVFFQDPTSTDSLIKLIATLPPNIKKRIVIANEKFPQIASLASTAESVISPDTGIAHLSGAVGARTLILTTIADPYLWNTGGGNVDFLATPQAMASHESRTPVNMIEWGVDKPLLEQAFTSSDILFKWKALLQKRLLGTYG